MVSTLFYLHFIQSNFIHFFTVLWRHSNQQTNVYIYVFILVSRYFSNFRLQFNQPEFSAKQWNCFVHLRAFLNTFLYQWMEIMYVLMYIHDMLSTFMRFLDNSTVNSFFNSNSHTYSRLQVISLYVPCINKILRRNNYWKLTENSKLSHISVLMILQIVQILKKIYKEQNKFMKIEIHMKWLRVWSWK